MSFLTEPLSLISIRPTRMIGEILVNVVLTENTTDTLTITKQPVQQGASITDHAYKEPTVFATNILFKYNRANPLDKIYRDLLELQASRIPFDIITPKRIYKSMLLANLTQTTDKNTEHCLAISASFQEIIIVKVSTTQVPRQKQKTPKKTEATENAGKKSILRTSADGVNILRGRLGF